MIRSRPIRFKSLLKALTKAAGGNVRIRIQNFNGEVVAPLALPTKITRLERVALSVSENIRKYQN